MANLKNAAKKAAKTLSGKKSYRVLQGIHLGPGDVPYGKGQAAGDIIHTEDDLLKLNSPGAQKFALLGINEDDSEESLLARKAEIEQKLQKLQRKKEKEEVPSEETPSEGEVVDMEGGLEDDEVEDEKASEEPSLDEMSFVELKDLAEKIGVPDLNKLKSKEELRVAIQAQRAE